MALFTATNSVEKGFDMTLGWGTESLFTKKMLREPMTSDLTAAINHKKIDNRPADIC